MIGTSISVPSSSVIVNVSLCAEEELVVIVTVLPSTSAVILAVSVDTEYGVLPPLIITSPASPFVIVISLGVAVRGELGCYWSKCWFSVRNCISSFCNISTPFKSECNNAINCV